MKTRLFFSALFFIFLTSLPAQNNLSIYDPQWWGGYLGQGTIDEAIYTLKPQGLYVEVGLYFTFSYPENYYSVWDSLEIVFDFNLPEEAMVNDSWLWVGNQIVRADIWEIWTAIQTYEEIVGQQKDPSVLYKKPDGGYQLRIFPLVELQSRRVKINYLLPVHWTEEEVIATLPTEFLRVSYNPVGDFRLLVFPDPAWQNYRIEESSNWEFQPISDPEFGPCLEADIPIGNAVLPMHFVMDAPLQQDRLFVGRYTGGEADVYHLAYFPDSTMETEKSSRLMVVVDYQAGNSSNMLFSKLLAILKTSLKDRLDENDFFNLTVGNHFNIYMAAPSGDWLPADDASIDWAFDNFVPSATLKPLIDLLLAAGDFIVEADQGGEMLLVSNTDEYNDWWFGDANDALDEFEENFGGAFPVHICDFQDQDIYEWGWACDDLSWEENCYKGNEYFSFNLAANTGGSFYDLLDNGADFHTNLTTQLNAIDGLSAVYELHTDMTNGLCYQRYPVTYLGQSEYMHLPVLQVGKYIGEFPMTVEFSAILDGQFISETFTVDESQVVELDTLAEESWVGNHLEILEANENAIPQTIDLSIQHRVLSKYTAFIALDPAQGGETCFGCLFNDGTIIETTEQLPEEKPRIDAFPNPFSGQTAIRLDGIAASEVHIYDQLGRLIRILQPAPTLLWDGRNGDGILLPPGVYFVVVVDEDGSQYEIKVVKQ